MTVVKNLFMWYYAAKAATITAGRAESMYHLRVTERAMLPFTKFFLFHLGWSLID